uniref:Uncharacterized protein n=1 Tax=Avena sativa TaxID=4498 RepID=A0ACD5VKM8_AVESA
MDIAEVAKKVDALQAELAAKDSRIDDLEARVSLLEAESARLRKFMPEGDAMDYTGKTGPTLGRLKKGFEGNKQKPVDILGEHVVNDVIEVGDGKEDGMAVDINKEKSVEEGVPAVPTPVKCAVRVVTCSDDEDDTKEAGGGGGDDHQGDDLSSIPRRKKRKSAIVISDSESEDDDVNGERHGIEEGEEGWEGIGKEVGDEDDGKTNREVIEKRREERSRDDGELGARRALEFSEPKDHEQSENSSEEADSSADFIDDADCSETSPDSAEEYSAEPEESDSELDYKGDIDRIGHKRNAGTEWAFEGDMLSAFAKQPELCLKAVCALYRKQTVEEQVDKATIVHNKRGFSQIHARRGSDIAQLLLAGDASGHLKKTAQDLKKYDRYGLKFCHKMASHYSKQLFAIYQNEEDPYFP